MSTIKAYTLHFFKSTNNIFVLGCLKEVRIDKGRCLFPRVSSFDFLKATSNVARALGRGRVYFELPIGRSPGC